MPSSQLQSYTCRHEGNDTAVPDLIVKVWVTNPAGQVAGEALQRLMPCGHSSIVPVAEVSLHATTATRHYEHVEFLMSLCVVCLLTLSFQ